jgi:hypothetical protein
VDVIYTARIGYDDADSLARSLDQPCVVIKGEAVFAPIL